MKKPTGVLRMSNLSFFVSMLALGFLVACGVHKAISRRRRARWGPWVGTPAMNLIFIIFIAASALLARPAVADIVRRTTIPSVMLGTWAEATEHCATKNQSNVSIELAKYADGSGSCVVQRVVETAGSRGPNYAVHALCTSAKDQSKTQIVNIIIRPQGNDQASMGRSFGALKTYQRCPAE